MIARAFLLNVARFFVPIAVLFAPVVLASNVNWSNCSPYPNYSLVLWDNME